MARTTRKRAWQKSCSHDAEAGGIAELLQKLGCDYAGQGSGGKREQGKKTAEAGTRKEATKRERGTKCCSGRHQEQPRRIKGGEGEKQGKRRSPRRAGQHGRKNGPHPSALRRAPSVIGERTRGRAGNTGDGLGGGEAWPRRAGSYEKWQTIWKACDGEMSGQASQKSKKLETFGVLRFTVHRPQRRERYLACTMSIPLFTVPQGTVTRPPQITEKFQTGLKLGGGQAKISKIF